MKKSVKKNQILNLLKNILLKINIIFRKYSLYLYEKYEFMNKLLFTDNSSRICHGYSDRSLGAEFQAFLRRI